MEKRSIRYTRRYHIDPGIKKKKKEQSERCVPALVVRRRVRNTHAPPEVNSPTLFLFFFSIFLIPKTLNPAIPKATEFGGKLNFA